jgi:hypothetical protein
MFGGPAVALRLFFISAVLGLGLLSSVGTTSALAQHVVTDQEAGKLTLDSLTATPRPIYRPILAVRRVHRPGYVSRSMHATRIVAYRRHSTSRSIRH